MCCWVSKSNVGLSGGANGISCFFDLLTPCFSVYVKPETNNEMQTANFFTCRLWDHTFIVEVNMIFWLFISTGLALELPVTKPQKGFESIRIRNLNY